jgi:acyl-CoA synthetase (AMP-forming)/AMP-acid ligase II
MVERGVVESDRPAGVPGAARKPEEVAVRHDVTTLRGRRADRRWNRMAVGDIFERVTWSAPNKTALVGCQGAYGDPAFERVTYAEADRAANRIAHALSADGRAPGDRVLLYCDNSIEAVLALFGIAKAGMVAVPVNPMLSPDVPAWAVDQVEPVLAVVDAGHHHRSAPVFAERSLPVVSIEIDADAPNGTASFTEWIAPCPDTELDVDVHGDDIWELLFTSGTTSMPKASMTAHSYSYLGGYSYAMSLTRGLAVETDLVLGTFLPIIYHCGHNSTVMPAMLSGGTAVIGRRPDAARLADAVGREGVTAIWAGSPLWVQKLVDEALARPAEVDLSSLTVAMFSWGAMRPDLAERLTEVAGPQVRMLEVFGQTESQSCFRFWPDREPAKHAESVGGVNHVGVPTPILAADIHDERGESVRGKPDVAGEAVYRGPMITAGYYRDEEATERAFAGGWFHSGDACAYTEDGSQVMVDRLKDIVKSGGENVSTMRVEGVLAAHPAVERVAVVGVPDEKWGEMVTAVVTVRPDSTVTAEELIAHARTRLAGYEASKRIEFVPEMPETVGGKIRKHVLRASLAGQG